MGQRRRAVRGELVEPGALRRPHLTDEAAVSQDRQSGVDIEGDDANEEWVALVEVGPSWRTVFTVAS